MRWAAAWSVLVLGSVLLVLSDALALPVWQLPGRATLADVFSLAASRALLPVLWLTVTIAGTATAIRTRWGVGGLLVLAGSALVPPLLSGHADHGGGSGQVATVAVVTHVLSAAVWAGGLAALVLHLRREDDLPVLASRFSALALPCTVLLLASGLLTALSIGADSDGSVSLAIFGPGSGYGRLLWAKSLLLAAAIGLGAWHRWRTLSLLRAGQPRSFVRTCAVEVSLLLGAVTLAAVLSRTPWV